MSRRDAALPARAEGATLAGSSRSSRASGAAASSSAAPRGSPMPPPSRIGSSSRAGAARSLLAPQPAAAERDRGGSPPAAHAFSHLRALLPFQRRILHALVPPPDAPLDDGDVLLILGRGMGLRAIVAALLRMYDNKDSLVILVGASDDEAQGIGEELDIMGARKPGMRRVGFNMANTQRQALYAQGGILSITSNILVTDMLAEKIPTAKIAGIVVLHAETVTHKSSEAFIARMYREVNKDGFMKAFSDDADRFAIGLSPLQSVLGQLRIRNVEIWPRFHKQVLHDLSRQRADVIQLHQPLSRSMRAIQTAIVECLDATLGELKRGAGSIDIEDCTVENALFRSFDSIVRRQLSHVWHRVGAKTRQLVEDLGTLRDLLHTLVTSDCVAFHQKIETILAAQSTGRSGLDVPTGPQSPWLFMDAANVILEEAKRRVYIGNVTSAAAAAAAEAAMIADTQPTRDELEDVDEDEEAAAFGTDAPAAPKPKKPRSARKWWMPPGIEPVLEEQPKWHLLRDVLDEVEQEVHWADVDLTRKQNNTILIMVESDSVCWQLREYLHRMVPLAHGSRGRKEQEHPGRRMMERRLKRHFFWKGNLGNMTNNLKRGGGRMNGPRAGQVPQAEASASTANYESAALKRKDNSAWDREASALKRRRQRGGAAGGGSSGTARRKTSAKEAPEELDREAGDVADFINRAIEMGEEDHEVPDLVAVDADLLEVDSDPDSGSEIEADETRSTRRPNAPAATQTFDEVEFESFFGILSPEDLVVVRAYRGDADDKMLQELRPRFVIMYDPQPAFVRRLEIYRASIEDASVRVYFLLYAESVEEQSYLSQMRREKESFERLVREKSIMALPLQADGRPASEVDDRPLRAFNSRAAGGQLAATSDAPRIVVDMREFRSSLPSMLHRQGVEVKPATLTVGDYILSPTMCVERKSIPDLIGSFNSGRLYNQCELMSVHYTHPILLIEFDEEKSFSSETISGPRGTSAPKRAITASTKPEMVDIQTKLVMLTIAFQRLRIIWSSSPEATAAVFLELKAQYEEPDVGRVTAVGQQEGGDEGGGGYNLTPQEVLLALPGINTKNFRFVMSAVRDVQELCDLSLAEMQRLIGVEPGRRLFNFVNSDVKRDRSLLT